jgi:hypothetical protein
MRGKGNRGSGRNFVVLTSGLSALLLGEERVGGLQPRQERGGKEEKEMRGKGNRGRGRKREEFCFAYFWPLVASSWRGKSLRPPALSEGCSGSSSRLSSR